MFLNGEKCRHYLLFTLHVLPIPYPAPGPVNINPPRAAYWWLMTDARPKQLSTKSKQCLVTYSCKSSSNYWKSWPNQKVNKYLLLWGFPISLDRIKSEADISRVGFMFSVFKKIIMNKPECFSEKLGLWLRTPTWVLRLEDSDLRTPNWGLRFEDSDLRTPTWGLWLEDSNLSTPTEDFDRGLQLRTMCFCMNQLGPWT